METSLKEIPTATLPVSQQKVKRAVCYIRESTKDQDKGFSPENQVKRIEEFVDRSETIELIGTYKDLLSGRSASNRKDFQEMIHDAETGKFDLILVYHTSRFARNVEEARHYKMYLRKNLNIDVVSVTQYFGDWDDPNAFINEGVNELFDEYLSRQISFWVKNNLMEKRMQGLEVGNPPFGYFKEMIGYDKDRDRTLYKRDWEIHPEESIWVKDVFEKYATGKYSFNDIVDYLNDNGVLTKQGHTFSYSSVKDLLKNRSYLGYITSPKRHLPEIKGKHKPLVSKELFDTVQRMIKKRRGHFGRPKKILGVEKEIIQETV